jgi:hypothetical protein
MVLRCRHDRRTEHGDEKQTRLGLALALGVLLWATGAGAAETPYQQGLGQLECVTLLIENLDADVRSLGLSEDQLRNVLLVATRAKLPRLRASDESCRNALYLIVTMGLNGKSGYYGAISVSVLRNARIVGTGEFVTAYVWETTVILKGPRDGVDDHVRSAIEGLTTKFAAAYYRAGNE